METVPLNKLGIAGLCSRRAFCGASLLALACLGVLAPRAGALSAAPDGVQTIYVIPGSHWDLGFVHPPEEIRRRIKPHLDAVMDACEKDPDFRWTIESGWQLDAWLEQTSDTAQVERMRALLARGQVELSAAYGSMHTEFMGDEELNRLVAEGARAEARLGVHPTVAVMDDVPGFSLRLPQVLARSGIRYFLTGSNTALGGGASLWPGKEPFRWESPDGSSVLVWQTQGKNGGYTEGLADYYLAPQAEDPYEHTKFYPKEWAGLSNLEIMQRGMDKLLARYRDAGYEHSALAVFFMHDAIGPEDELDDLLPDVRAWNAAGKQPRIVVATPSEFFKYLAAGPEKVAPDYRGDWSGLWAAVKVNSPAMSADARRLQEKLPEAEELWSLARASGSAVSYPGAELEADWRDLLGYDEHNGAGQGSWPDVLTSAEVEEQNREYAGWLRGGVGSVDALFEQGLAKVAGAKRAGDGGREFLVWNPHSWARSSLVTVKVASGGWRVVDMGSGKEVPSQVMSTGELCFEAREVPSLGYRTYRIERANGGMDAAVAGSKLVSPYFEAEWDAATGELLRVTDLRAHRVLMSKAGLLRDDTAYLVDGPVVVHHESGVVVDRLVVERSGSLWPRTVITLPRDEAEVLVDETLDRGKMRFVGDRQPRDMYSFAFDFGMDGGAQRWIDDGEGLYRFPQDLLPGARQDGVIPRHTAVLSARDYSVYFSGKQSFYDRLRMAGDGSQSQEVIADALIKNDQTKTKDSGVTTFASYEPGYPQTYQFSFAITGQAGGADAVEADHLVIDDGANVYELPEGEEPAEMVKSFLSVNAPNVVVETLKPADDEAPGDLVLRLQEIAGRETQFRLQTVLPVRSIAETTLTGDRVVRDGIAAGAIHISAHQTLSLRLSLDSAGGAH